MPCSTDVIFHPFLFGSNVQANARAGFYGLAGWHTKAHVLRALYEGVVYGHLAHVDKLRAAGAQIALPASPGGGSRSLVWTQMFADALQLAIEVPDGSEVAARGRGHGRRHRRRRLCAITPRRSGRRCAWCAVTSLTRQAAGLLSQPLCRIPLPGRWP